MLIAALAYGKENRVTVFSFQSHSNHRQQHPDDCFLQGQSHTWCIETM